MATAHDWSYLEANASQRPFDYDQPNTKLSWDDFSTFYKTANDWDYPVDGSQSTQNTNTTNPNPTKTNDDMFKNHGSHHSMDILADEMNTKWSYNITTNTTDTDTLPADPKWKTTSSTIAQASNSITATQRMQNFLDEDSEIISPLYKKTSITDSQGIDVTDDTQIKTPSTSIHMSKDDEIKSLKQHINQLQNENKLLIEQNSKLKKRNVDLRKTLHKAQQYRRKSSIAVQNLMNITKQINNSTAQHENEQKVREEEELNNLKIQQQIQQAITMFQEEFGAELDDELNNIESFQYESLPDECGSEHGDNVFHFDSRNIEDPLYKAEMSEAFFNTEKKNTVNKFGQFEPNANGVDFNIKFTDAHSEYVETDDDVLPDSYNTPGGPSDFDTPGGPSDFVTPGGDVENDKKLNEMGLRLNELSEKMLGLMERIQDLTDKNQQLEVSKLELITNTANAMNLYRDTVRRLSKQNQMLVNRIKLK